MIPISELGLERDADPRGAFSPGEKIKLKLLGLDPNRRRISLSVRAIKRDQERQEYTPHMESGADAEPAVTGFGAQLAAALDKGEAKKATAAKKKAPAKKATEKKTTAKKAADKKPTTKKATAKKTTKKKATTKKAPAKKKTTTKKKTASKKATEKK